MSTPTSGLPPAGWYTDPSSAIQERWWDGSAWTSHERPLPVAAPEPAAAEPAPFTPEPVAAEQQPGWSQSFDPSMAAATLRATRTEPQVEFAPPQAGTAVQFGENSWGTSSPQTSYRDIPTHSNTLPVWVLVFWPLVMTTLWTIAIAAITALSTLAGTTEFLPWTILITCAALGLLPFFWAARDRYLLTTLGYQRPAHWAWLFLSPLAYLIARVVRTRTEASRGAAPLVTHVVFLIVWFVASNVVALALNPAPSISQSIVDGVEQGIEEGAADSGVSVVAECPDDASAFAPHKSFDCSILLADGRVASVTVTWGAQVWATPSISDPVFSTAPATN